MNTCKIYPTRTVGINFETQNFILLIEKDQGKRKSLVFSNAQIARSLTGNVPASSLTFKSFLSSMQYCFESSKVLIYKMEKDPCARNWKMAMADLFGFFKYKSKVL